MQILLSGFEGDEGKVRSEWEEERKKFFEERGLKLGGAGKEKKGGRRVV